MLKRKNKIIYTIIPICLVLVLLACMLIPNNIINSQVAQVAVEYTESEIRADFDFYTEQIDADGASVVAYKTYSADEIVDVNIGETSSVRIAYSLEYDYESEIIYVAMSTFDDNEDLINVELLDAYPIYYEDGSFDALVALNDDTILLSELQAGSVKDCFALTLVIGGGIALGKLLAGLLIGAGVAVGGVIIYKTVEVAVKSGWFTYKTKSLTEDKVRARTKKAERQKTKKNPDVYYLAELYDGKVCVNSSPWTLKTATTRILKDGNSFWTPLQPHALLLVTAASGGFAGPEKHYDHTTGSDLGYYYHYHPLNRVINGYKNVHVWYGAPIGGVY